MIHSKFMPFIISTPSNAQNNDYCLFFSNVICSCQQQLEQARLNCCESEPEIAE
jgi:hypothetical protein